MLPPTLRRETRGRSNVIGKQLITLETKKQDYLYVSMKTPADHMFTRSGTIDPNYGTAQWQHTRVIRDYPGRTPLDRLPAFMG